MTLKQDTFRAFGIEPGSYAEKCAEINTFEELIAMTTQLHPDTGILVHWGLTELEWREHIAAALRFKLTYGDADAPIERQALRQPMRLVK